MRIFLYFWKMGNKTNEITIQTSDVGLASACIPHWYTLRTTYGREKRTYDYLHNKGIKVFCPTKEVYKLVKGKKKRFLVSLIPNMLFAFGTEEELDRFVYDNVHLPFLRYYYHRKNIGEKIVQAPLIIPQKQMDSFKIICEANDENIIFSSESILKFETGKKVKIIDGAFKGVEGRVGRFRGQQRVGVVIEDLMSIITAYIPNAFLQEL